MGTKNTLWREWTTEEKEERLRKLQLKLQQEREAERLKQEKEALEEVLRLIEPENPTNPKQIPYTKFLKGTTFNQEWQWKYSV